jgi:pyocin large subunit-like protein
MSERATRWAEEHPLRGFGRQCLLLVLARFANDDDLLWPSVRTLSVRTGGDKASIVRLLKELRDTGLIEDTGERRGQGSATVYRFCYAGQPEVAAEDEPAMARRSENAVMNGHDRDLFEPSDDLPDDDELSAQCVQFDGRRTRGSRVDDASNCTHFRSELYAPCVLRDKRDK